MYATRKITTGAVGLVVGLALVTGCGSGSQAPVGTTDPTPAQQALQPSGAGTNGAAPAQATPALAQKCQSGGDESDATGADGSNAQDGCPRGAQDSAGDGQAGDSGSDQGGDDRAGDGGSDQGSDNQAGDGKGDGP
jgi:hypothetical protein